MTDIIDRLKEPEAHYPGNFDTPKRANAMLSCLCQEAMEEIESLRQQLKHITDQYLAALDAERMRYRQVVEKDAEIERLNNSLRDQFCYCVGQHCHNLGVCQTCKKPVAGWFDVAQQALESFGAAQVEMYAKKEELAAIQAREQELRGAFQTYIDEHEECTDADDWMAMTCSMEAHHVADEALAQPADTTALEAMITKAGEVMRERCAVRADWFTPFVGGKIRALPGVTLEDIK